MEAKQLSRYIGQCIEIMYMDKKGMISQRFIEVRSIKKDYVCAYCIAKKGLRVFNMENILAVFPTAKQWSV